MKILTFNRRTVVHTRSGEFKAKFECNPGERVIVDDLTATQLLQNQTTAPLLHGSSDLAPYLPRVIPSDWAGKNVLFYRGRGIGDEIMMTALPKYFTEVLGANCFVLCQPVHEQVWAFNEYLTGNPIMPPVHLDAISRHEGKPFFDFAYFLESVTEWDTESDQTNVYDTLYRMVGIDPATVNSVHKRPHLKLDRLDVMAREKWYEDFRKRYPLADLSRGYIFYQARASHLVRTLPPERAFEILQTLRDTGLPVLVVDDAALSGRVQFACRTPGIYDIAGMIPHLRLYIALIANAKLLVGPDSSGIHVAAAFGTPAISFWGAYSPPMRIKHYPDQVGIYHGELCKNSPCFQDKVLPAHKCPRGSRQTHCEVFDGITMDELNAALARFEIGKHEKPLIKEPHNNGVFTRVIIGPSD